MRLVTRAFLRLVSTRSAWGHNSHQRQKQLIALTAAGIGLGVGVAAAYRARVTTPPISSAECKEKVEAGQVIDGLPEYTLGEIQKHSTPGDGRVWVTYKYGVYDITEFLAVHPGGSEKISLAAGSSLEPYWAVFANHNTEEVRDILEGLRIGNIAKEDRGKITQRGPPGDGPYANDPLRSPVLKVNTQTPFNAETPSVLLADNYITPNDIFYIRNHLPVPRVDPEQYSLEIKGEGIEKPITLTLDDLKSKFPKHKVTATVQCAGNRRIELNKVKQVKGIPWTGGAIGTAEWSGARLRDVLLYAGIKEDDVEHVHLEGLDNNPLTGERYGSSIPASKAMSSTGDCLLAYEMNGVEIPVDHGYPVRAIVPGVVGARNVKWLATVVASKEEYNGFWQKNDYKGFSPSTDWSNVDFSTAPSIQELPVTSFISSPTDGAKLSKDEPDISLRGIAWSGGGREVVRVDVSADGGETWHVAEIIAGAGQPYMRAWAWVVWEATIPVPSSRGEVELCCKAVDRSYNVQPDTAGPIWNLRGCLSNAWHRIHVTLSKD
jgi:sulfite oxidase